MREIEIIRLSWHFSALLKYGALVSVVELFRLYMITDRLVNSSPASFYSVIVEL
jgi:hypothetical protein